MGAPTGQGSARTPRVEILKVTIYSLIAPASNSRSHGYDVDAFLKF